MTFDSRVSSIVFALTAAMILLLAFAATAAIANGGPSFLRMPFHLICHGIPSHCFTVWGTAMPICARCTGIYVGMLIGILGFAVTGGLGGRRFPPALMLLMVAPLAVDGVTQALGLRLSTNPLRVATGLVAGAGFLLWALAAIETNARRKLHETKAALVDRTVETVPLQIHHS